MSATHKTKDLIGRVEKVHFPQLGNAVLYARIDTGAKTSSIWATDIVEADDGLHVRFCSPEHEIYTHKVVFAHYGRVRVISSTGHEQVRYKVKMPIVIGGRKILASFTLADRKKQVYPVLIGRLTLTGKFIVDVAQGDPLREREKYRSSELQKNITEEQI